VLSPDAVEEKFAQLEKSLAEIGAERDQASAERALVAQERDEYKKLYLSTLELCRRLERGLLSQQRERFTGGDSVTMSLLALLKGEN
jgi:hypothetical protein